MLNALRPCFLLPLILLVVMPISVAAQFAGGDGSSGNPYQIATCSQLQSISTSLSSSYLLTNNIDCTGSSAFNSGASFDPIGEFSGSPFSGTLDGQFFTINGLTIHRTGESHLGLFAFTTGATIQRVKLTNLSIQGIGHLGGLVGQA